MENFPSALIVASCDEVYRNNNVLYRLVKPTAHGSGVESTNRLVNVVPFRRVYQFKAKHEIEEFVHEILRRPLVLQPIMHFGRGLGNCGACYNEEQWVVMVNQTHPKILSRLQMGLDAARVAFDRGHSAELKFNFGKAIQRLYQDHLWKKEMEDARGSKLRTMLTFFRYSEWEHADLIVRFHGYSEMTSGRNRSGNVDMTWNFEDIDSGEVIWSQAGDQMFPRPHLSHVSEEEIRQMLPTWTINGVSPLLDIGEEIPHLNYSYAKAGTLYESFRKKKRQRASLTAERMHPDQAVGRDFSEADIGAVGGYDDFDAIEHDFTQRHEDEKQSSLRSKSRRAYINEESPNSNIYYPHDEYNRHAVGVYENEHYTLPSSSHGAYQYENVHNSRYSHHYNMDPHQSSTINGHVDADVKIVTPVSGAGFERSDRGSSHLYENSLRLKKQDSDRSTGSTNADSGYCESGRRSRGDSYDYNDNVGSSRSKNGTHIGDKLYNSEGEIVSEGGLDNPAFSHGDEEDPLARHKQLVADAVAVKTKHLTNVSHDNQQDMIKHYGSPMAVNHDRVNETEQIAESFI